MSMISSKNYRNEIQMQSMRMKTLNLKWKTWMHKLSNESNYSVYLHVDWLEKMKQDKLKKE